MIIKDLATIRFDRKGKLLLSKEDRATLGDKVVIIRKQNRLLLFTEEE